MLEVYIIFIASIFLFIFFIIKSVYDYKKPFIYRTTCIEKTFCFFDFSSLNSDKHTMRLVDLELKNSYIIEISLEEVSTLPKGIFETERHSNKIDKTNICFYTYPSFEFVNKNIIKYNKYKYQKLLKKNFIFTSFLFILLFLCVWILQHLRHYVYHL